MANESNWTPAELILKAPATGAAWIIYITDERQENYLGAVRSWKIKGREAIPRGDAKQYADLFVASPELLEALEPDDRLNAATMIHPGYRSTSSVETVHLLHCRLREVQEQPERFNSPTRIAQEIKNEIQRLIDRAEKALAKAQGEQPHAE